MGGGEKGRVGGGRGKVGGGREGKGLIVSPRSQRNVFTCYMVPLISYSRTHNSVA